MPSHLEVPCLGRVVAAKNTAQFLPASTTTTSTSQHAPQGQEKKCRREGRAVFTAPPPAPRACDAHRGSASGRACPREMDAERKTRKRGGQPSHLAVAEDAELLFQDRVDAIQDPVLVCGGVGVREHHHKAQEDGEEADHWCKKDGKWSLFSLIMKKGFYIAPLTS